jgi:CDP-paratose 2-epimerase
LSLRETTELCRAITGRDVRVDSIPENRPGDVRIYVSDCRKLFSHTEWRPARGPEETLGDIHDWIAEHEELLAGGLA